MSQGMCTQSALNPAVILAKFEDDERVYEDFHRPDAVDAKVKIKVCYSPELAEAFAALRFLLDKDEHSARGLLLSQYIITNVKNHYAAWAYRKAYLLKENSVPLYEAEIALAYELIMLEPKGFQSWDHLRFCNEHIGRLDYETMTAFFDKIYALDTKNYHMWSYRVWATKQFHLAKSEFEWANILLKKEITNNSIWSYRHFLAQTLKIDKNAEKAFVTAVIEGGELSNESAWYYLDDIYESEGAHSGELEAFLNRLMEGHKTNRFVLKSAVFNELRKSKTGRRGELVAEWLRLLVTKYDANRARFWDSFAKSFNL